MKVFLSWSGNKSRAVAQVLHETLPCMLQGVEVFLSKHDIESGERWGTRIAEELSASSFGVLCLTPTNLSSSWLVFEAGALTKHIDGRACGLLLDGLSSTNVTGPIAQFQHQEFSRSGLKSLVSDINKLADSPLGDSNVERIFDKWWPDLKSGYDTAIQVSESEDSISPKRSERDLLEEVLLLCRGLHDTPTQSKKEGLYSIGNMDKITHGTLGKFIDSGFEKLSSTEKALLLDIVRAKAPGVPGRGKQILQEADDSDIDVLVSEGFIRINDDGNPLMHKIIGHRLLTSGLGIPAS